MLKINCHSIESKSKGMNSLSLLNVSKKIDVPFSISHVFEQLISVKNKYHIRLFIEQFRACMEFFNLKKCFSFFSNFFFFFYEVR